MALESGGFADKFGNSYEAVWVAKQLLKLAEEEIRSVIVEPLGDDETGVDLIVEDLKGQREFHQCKSSHKYADAWTLARLDEAGVLKKAYDQIRRTNCVFKIVSPFSFTQLAQLSQSAKNTTPNPEDFIRHQIKPSQERTKFFEDLCARLKSYSDDELTPSGAINFLRNFEVIAFQNSSDSIESITKLAQPLFIDNPINIIDFLKNYPIAFNKLRSPITSSQLFRDMRDQGFNQRVYQDDERVAPIIQRINRDFESTIKPNLIDDILIERPELDECIESLDTHPIIMIEAEAGMGKSVFLLQLNQYAYERGYITLPIRLDRNRPKNNIDAFGRDLGLTHSPVFCLNVFAGTNKAIIVLDQLDAIRWTSNHSNNALQICQEIASQVIHLRENNIDICLVLACRGFDLKDDPQLQHWISGLDNKIKHVTLSALSVEQIKEIINPYENYDSLSPVKKDILRVPIWLNLYLKIASSDFSSLNFNSKVDLVSLYWSNRLNLLNEMSIDTSLANSIIEEFIAKANQDMQFSLPINVFNSPNPEALNALISIGVLQEHNNKISFQHQALFDYHLGKRLFDIARQSSDDLLLEIGSKSEQTLTRREHIKYALKLLAQYKQTLFCDNVSALIDSSNIRFHIKYLAINVTREITDIKMPLRKLILGLIDDEVLGQPFINHVCFGQPQFVEVLSNTGVIKGWLNGDDSQMDLAIRLLNSIADKASDIVLREIEPFISRSEQWNNRCYSALSWNLEDDSDEMFDVRKHLISLGCSVSFIDWGSLVKRNPRRALELIQLIIEYYKEELTDASIEFRSNSNQSHLRHRKVWREAQIEDLEAISKDLPHEVLEKLIPQVFETLSYSTNQNDYRSIWFYRAKHSLNENRESLVKGLLKIIFHAGKHYSDKPESLLSILSPYLDSEHPVVEFIIANLFLNLSVDYSDQIIEWLLANPKTRLACGNDYEEPKWVLPGKLLEKFSQNCSDDLFNILENAILKYGVSKEIEDIKSIFYSRKKHNYFKNSYWGEAQYFLLSQLDVNRVSLKSIKLYQVLKRRFESHTNTDFYSLDYSGGGAVISPLSHPNKMSDRAWRNLILTPDEKLNSGSWCQVDEHTIAESTIWTFARSLGTAVTNEPTRFAKLALTLPTNINREFIESIYYGLAETDPASLADEFKDEWKACPLDLRYQVIEHFEGFTESQSLTRLLAGNPNIVDYPKMLDRLIDIAFNSDNPKPKQLVIGNGNPEQTTAENLIQNSINCYRGIAYGGISRIFWKNKDFAMKNKHLVESAVKDVHPAVKIVSTELMAPFLNYDKPYALAEFLKLCHTDLRMSCGRYHYYFFNSAFTGEFKDDYVALVKRMISSEFKEVRKQAGQQIFARYIFNDLFNDELEEFLNSIDEEIKLGIADVLVQFITMNDYAEHEHRLVEVYKVLINSDSKKVRDKVGLSIREKNYWNKSITKDLFRIYMDSNVENINLYHLFYALDNHVIYLDEVKEMILELISKIIKSTLSTENQETFHLDANKLTKILQRIYDEAVDDEDDDTLNMCLDIWDNLLMSDNYAVRQVSKQLETGLLS